MNAVRDAFVERGLLRWLFGNPGEKVAVQAPLYKSTAPLRNSR